MTTPRAVNPPSHQRKESGVRERPQHESLRYVFSTEVHRVRWCVAEILGHRQLAEADAQEMGAALEELLLNAMVHGNLEIPAGLGDGTSCCKAWKQMVNERTSSLPYCQRTVRVAAHWTKDCVVVTVSDMGHGFDWRALPALPASEDASGRPKRGIAMARLMVDSLTYNDDGNEVTIVKRLRPVGS